ncbi:MAG: NAD(P)-dependent oxidoreductase [Bacteroidota bacterium]
MLKETLNNKVLLLDTNHDLLQERLEEAGFVCDSFPDLTLDQLKNIIGDYAGIIVRSRFQLNVDLLSLAGKLAFIGRVGAGMEGIDIGYAEQAGISCFNAPEGNRNAVGEHALGMLLALMNNMIRADDEVRNGIWKREENRGEEIEGKTIGIIGYGNTGGAFAKKLYGFDCRVIAYDKYKQDFSDEYVEEVNMDEVFSAADILSLHVPLTEETNYLVNTDYLQQFSKDIWLMNTARGKVVNTADLVEAVSSGKVRGAALDVLEYESSSFEDLSSNELPEEYKFLASSDKVILSPHIAGWTHESKQKLAIVIVDKILARFKAY